MTQNDRSLSATPCATETPVTDTISPNTSHPNREHLLREAARRGVPGWASPASDRLLRSSLRLRIIGVLGAALITVVIGVGVLRLMGFSL